MNCLCLLHRCQPSFCCPSAPGPACAPGLSSNLEGDEAEGRDAVWGRGGICDIGLRDCPRAAHREAPGQAGTGAERTGECVTPTLQLSSVFLAYLSVMSGLPSPLTMQYYPICC